MLVRIPHKEKRQILGLNLTIIGISVNANNLTLTLPPDSKSDLISQLNEFARTSDVQAQAQSPEKPKLSLSP